MPKGRCLARLDDAEGSLLGASSAQRGVGHTRLSAHLHGMDHALGVEFVNLLIIGGVEALEFIEQRLESMLLPLLLDGVADVVADVGDGVDATAHGVDIHH